jgi:tRNA (guanine6-N2)-methyltransferase
MQTPKAFLLTTDYAVEHLAMAEITEKIPLQRIEQFAGWQQRIYIETTASLAQLFALRSVHSLIELVKVSWMEEPTLEQIVAEFEGLEIPHLRQAQSFRASAERYGNHDFTSVDIQKHIGAATVRKYQIPVSLEDYQINLRIDLLGKDVFIGIQHNRYDLSTRPHLKRSFHHRAAIKHTLAYILLRLLNPQQGETILDATVGGATILLEAYDAFNREQNLSLRLMGTELNAEFAQKAIENVELNGFDISIKHADARELNLHFEAQSVDKIIANLPYGVVSGKQENMRGLYDRLLTSAHSILRPNGKMVLLTMRGAILRETLFRLRLYKISQETITESGGLLLHIFVLQKV